jgi:hypothetical protein
MAGRNRLQERKILVKSITSSQFWRCESEGLDVSETPVRPIQCAAKSMKELARDRLLKANSLDESLILNSDGVGRQINNFQEKCLLSV